MERLAQCSCGAVKLATQDEPSAVVACHCLECQRCTGSVLGVGAYFAEDQIRITGATQRFLRSTASGNEFHMHFCPTCGTSLYWRTGNKPGFVDVAVGAFADPSFPAPIRSVWERFMHPWVSVGNAQQRFAKGRVS